MKKKSYNSPWSLQFNTAALVLIPAAVGINYLGKLFAGVLKLPLWMDSIGTCLAACLAGPVVGAICGAINNIIYGLTMSPISMVYAFSQAGIGIVVGLMAYYGRMNKIGGAVATGILAGLAAVSISTPLNIAFWGGTTGNLWGDAVYALSLAKDLPVWLASLLDEIVVDLPDKIVTVIIVMGMYRGMPKSLQSLYQSNGKIESLD
ncbi:ECF transporter S component [Hespellia stercorisuis]|uniref:Energy-coupling factor transport system substrate-specific component n=1 Tax=Hespellia stercorisuis DSM 15480 TaxID=1121950 RepID=A0A1M6LY26_9FIRM|nr:ECF transporter S component [Hespellia stercorisuis]SHJ76167.1 energy-coupling factor transport system substrate-specific component [Hespellia stercorisuis DSM 15480]